MTAFRAIALVLIIAGAIALVSPAITFTSHDTILEVGPLEVTKEEKTRFPVLPIFGGAAIVLGIGLLITDRKKPA